MKIIAIALLVAASIAGCAVVPVGPPIYVVHAHGDYGYGGGYHGGGNYGDGYYGGRRGYWGR